MEAYEVYDNRVPLHRFQSLRQKRWQAFGRQAAAGHNLTVFECAFLQNHVTEMVYMRLADDSTIKAHFNTLTEAIAPLEPFLVYLQQPDMRQTILQVAAQRGGWIDGFTEYAENSPYGRLHKPKGLDAVLKCLEERKRVEMEFIRALPIRSVILDNPTYDWNGLWNRLSRELPFPSPF